MGTWDYDISSQRVVWSPQVEAIHGLEPGTFEGTFEAYTRDIHPLDRRRVAQTIQSSIQAGCPHDVEYRLVRPDGTIVWVQGKGDLVRDKQGEIVGLAGVCMDVTERRQRESLLLGQKEAKELILRGAPLEDVLLSLAQLAESQYQTPVRAAIWRLSEDGRRFEVGSAPNLSHSLCAGLLQGMEDQAVGRGRHEPEIVENISLDPRWIMIASQLEAVGLTASWSWPFVSSDGKLLGLFALYHPEPRPPSLHDLQLMEVLSQTAAIAIERVMAHENLLKAIDAADAASRAKSQFLANVSHEIRTPMTGITGAVNLLQQTDVSDDQAEFLTMIKSCSEVLLTVINDVLDISKIEAGELRLDPQPFDPVEVVKECVSLMQQPASQGGLDLNLSLSEPLPRRVVGDTVRLRQIILNLLNNAVKFTEQGSVRVRLSRLEDEQDCVKLRFEVEDTGIGISAEAQKLLFRPFSQVDEGCSRRYGGSGLGLSISRQLVEMMDGSIGVESRVGEGSRFWFVACFPLIRSGEGSAETVDMPPVGKGRDPSLMKLLVAEDNPINRRVLNLQLQQLGYQADSASNGLEALQLLTRQSYDLVLMDCQMPHMDGYEVARQVRSKKLPHQPVIVALTAHALEGEKEKCLQAGMDGYLRKPLAVKELRRTLEDWSRSDRLRKLE
jgi:PAS domain S-box-containing protein